MRFNIPVTIINILCSPVSCKIDFHIEYDISHTSGSDYTGFFRPQVHFSPPQGFANDPNGLFLDAQGTYHMYYQYNPTDTVAGNQHWGHATSTDLYHWTHQPIALYPQNSSEGVFSGSCIVDHENRSGFFPSQKNGVVAIFTSATHKLQTQNLAYSLDNGYTFTRYEHNPVVDVNSPDFRDPKVFWHSDTQRWIMIVAHAIDQVLGLYTSTDLRSWTLASNFTSSGVPGILWECPNLVPLPVLSSSKPSPAVSNVTLWLLLLSTNPGCPLGGSCTHYLIGCFNGTHFTPLPDPSNSRTSMQWQAFDFGKDNYAAQLFYGIPEDQVQVSIAWAGNWQYANHLPSGPREGWQGMMTLPKRHWLEYVDNHRGIEGGVELRSLPMDLTSVMRQRLVNQTGSGNGQVNLSLERQETPLNGRPPDVGVQETVGQAAFHFGTNKTQNARSKSILLNITITSLKPATLPNIASLNITLSSSHTSESLTAGQFFHPSHGGDNHFYMSRAKTRGFENPFYTGQTSVLVDLRDREQWDVLMLVDRSVWEVFLDGGRMVGTLGFWTEGVLDHLAVCWEELGEAKVNVEVWELGAD